jgi:hypothetical protein
MEDPTALPRNLPTTEEQLARRFADTWKNTQPGLVYAADYTTMFLCNCGELGKDVFQDLLRKLFAIWDSANYSNGSTAVIGVDRKIAKQFSFAVPEPLAWCESACESEGSIFSPCSPFKSNSDLCIYVKSDNPEDLDGMSAVFRRFFSDHNIETTTINAKNVDGVLGCRFAENRQNPSSPLEVSSLLFLRTDPSRLLSSFLLLISLFREELTPVRSLSIRWQVTVLLLPSSRSWTSSGIRYSECPTLRLKT